MDAKCVNCSGPVTLYEDLYADPICPKCYRDPKTNNCDGCGKHLEGIAYPYTCGTCVMNDIKPK